MGKPRERENVNTAKTPPQLEAPRGNAWILAMRPKTLPAAIVPVVMGGAMAYGDGVFHFFSVFVALAGALLIQIGTNLVNDYADFKKGTDNNERIGPVRVTQAGLVTQKQMVNAVYITFMLAVLISIYLVYRGGWPIVVIGVSSIISGVLYTAGPKPLGYLGLGDLFVLIFFGPVAVAGTYYVQALTLNVWVPVIGLGPGLISVAILAVNNLRDIDGDRRAGKNTLAVRFGRTFAMYEYFYALVGACLIPVFIPVFTHRSPMVLLPLLTLIFVPGALRTVFSKRDGASLNGILAYTGRLLVIYGILFSIGWVSA